MVVEVFVGNDGLEDLRNGYGSGAFSIRASVFRTEIHCNPVYLDKRRLSEQKDNFVLVITSYKDSEGNVFNDVYGDIWLNENNIRR